MIPSGLENEHFFEAADRIDHEGVPAERQSYRYDVVLRGKLYPPKYVISLACGIATGTELPSNRFNAIEAKNHFRRRGIEVIDRHAAARAKIKPEDEASVFPEGAERYRLHRSRERNSSVAIAAKTRRFEETGELRCDVCSLDFGEMYGSYGAGFIEAHHTVPVATLDDGATTKLSDIALVCSNCQRMLHRGPQLLSVDALRAIVERQISEKAETGKS